MSFIVTPAELSRRAEFYHQLSMMTSAGIPILGALEHVCRSSASQSFAKPASILIREVTRGCTFTEALQATGNWLPDFDRALLTAGELSGRLEACFGLLDTYYGERARLARQVLSELSYPIFVMGAAILIFPLSSLKALVLQGQGAAFLIQKLSVVVPLGAAVAGGIYASQGQRSERWRAFIEKVLRKIPGIGAAKRNLAIARLAAALEALINAGVPIIEAWELAAAASGSPALRRVVAEEKPRMFRGDTPAEMVARQPLLDEPFRSLYRTAELTGDLDKSLRRLHVLYQERATSQLRLIAQWVPRMVYLIIVCAVALQIIGFYTEYFNQVKDLL